jgi:hypothetical protein
MEGLLGRGGMTAKERCKVIAYSLIEIVKEIIWYGAIIIGSVILAGVAAGIIRIIRWL